MRILHVITTLDVGGAEMHVLALVRGQVERGHTVRIAYLKGYGTLESDFREAGAELVVRVPLGLGTLPRLWPHLRWAEIVHSHLLKSDMLTAVAATLAGRRARLVAGKHNDEQVLKRFLVSFTHRVLGKLPRLTIVLSEHVGRFIEAYGGVPAAKRRRVYYGIDPAPFDAAAPCSAEERAAVRAELGCRPDDVVFVCVARFAPQKAHDVLLRAFAEARSAARSPAMKLVLVGDDPFGDGRQRAERVAAQLELEGDVVFTGIRRDVPRVLAASDVFVLASLWEGLGLVFLESMAARLPIIATSVSAIAEVVVDGQTGLLVPAKDASAMAQAMLRLARDPELRRSLGLAGRARVERVFGLPRMVDETLQVYAEVRGTR